MSIAARHQRTASRLDDARIREELLRRLNRMLIALATVALAVGGGWLGLLFREYIDRIIVTAIAIVVVPYAVYLTVQFFRDPDD